MTHPPALHEPAWRRSSPPSCAGALSRALAGTQPYADEVDAFLAKGGGLEAVRELKAAGVVKHFGCGAREHGPHLQLLEACGAEDFEICQTVDDENPLRRFMDQLGLREAMTAAGVGLINAAPLYRGLLVDAPKSYYGCSGEEGGGGAGAAYAAVLGKHASSHVELAALAQEMAECAVAPGCLHTRLMNDMA